MLFPLNPQTPRCAVFELLNDELLYFLEASVPGGQFSQALFRSYQSPNGGIPSVGWSNAPTRDKFRDLWEALPDDEGERQRLFDTISQAQDIRVFFNDTEAELPELVPGHLFEAFKSLTTHLFTRTKDLAETRSQSNSSVEHHYQQFLQANRNSELCPICGTAALSQRRTDIGDDDQWRADYDHVLCKDKYPVYSVHPGNFVPTCHICNSKAKGARNVLMNQGGRRRTAFYPLPPSQESCYQYATIAVSPKTTGELKQGEWDSPLTEAVVSFENASADVAAKINVWKEVYKVPVRVQHHITTQFFEHIVSDLRPRNFDDFCSQLRRYSATLPPDFRSLEWRFWWHCVYEYLVAQNRVFLEDLWTLIDWKTQQASDADMQATFG